jgi:uncharacterized protein
MKGGLPEHIDPLHLADTAVQLAGDLPVARLERLAGLLARHDGVVRVEARFGSDEQGRRVLHLKATTSLEMTCQRCMGTVTIPVVVDTTLELVPDEAGSARTSERYEPLLVERGRMSLAEIVEDELLLQVPMIPRHEIGDRICTPAAEPTEKQETAKVRESPFAVLANLKEKQ